MNLAEVREKYPQYNDLPDSQLVEGMHQRYYSDLPFEDFAVRVGYDIPATTPTFGSEAISAPKEFGKGVIKGGLELGQSLGTGLEMVGQEMKKDRSSIIANRPERWGLLTPTQMKEVVTLKQSYLKAFKDPDIAEQRAFEDVLRKESQEMAPSGDFLIKQGKTISDFWKGRAEKWQPSITRAGKIEELNVWDNPELLGSPVWWAFNVGRIMPSFLASIVPGTIAAKSIQAAGLAANMTPKVAAKLAKIGGMVTGGLAGGTLEGTGTYQQLIEGGASHEEAFRAAKFMTFFSAGLNSLSVGRMLEKAGPGFMAKVTRRGINGIVEGITEGAEEPAEVISIIASKLMGGEELPEDVVEMFVDSFKDAITIAGPAALTGFGMSGGGAVRTKTEEEKDSDLLDRYDEAEPLTDEADNIAKQVIDKISKGPMRTKPPTPQEIAQAEELRDIERQQDIEAERADITEEVPRGTAPMPEKTDVALEGMGATIEGARPPDVEGRRKGERRQWETRDEFDKLISKAESVEEARELAGQMTKKAYTDKLTGLKNRAAYMEYELFDDELPTEHKKHKAILDIDNFSWVNDVFGHKAGDDVLAKLGKTIKAHTDEGYRYGGEEFVITGDDIESLNLTVKNIESTINKAELDYVLSQDTTTKSGIKYKKGQRLILEGLGLSYGIDKEFKQADGKLYREKDRKLESGERAPAGEIKRLREYVSEPGKDRKDRRGPAGLKPLDKVEVLKKDLPKPSEPTESIKKETKPETPEKKEVVKEPTQAKPAAEKKEPWEMTLSEYESIHGKPSKGATSYTENTFHKNAVHTAINQGKSVPEEVLKDYPDLKKKPPTDMFGQPVPTDIFGEAIPETKKAKQERKTKEKRTPTQAQKPLFGEDKTQIQPKEAVPKKEVVDKTPEKEYKESEVSEKVKPYEDKQQTIDFKFKEEKPAKSVPSSRRVRMATSGRILAASQGASSASDVASLLAHIRKSAQEIAYTVTVDKNDTILEIHKYSKGKRGSSQISPVEVSGHVLNVSDANTVYFVHNHPSGTTTASDSDIAIIESLEKMAGLKDIRLKTLIIAGTKYREYSTDGKPLDKAEENIKPIKRPVELPEKERALAGDVTGLPKLRGPEMVSEYFENVLNDQEGSLFLDAQNRPVGFLKFTPGEPQKKITADIVSTAEKTNAIRFIFKSNSDIFVNYERKRFLKALGKQMGKDLILLDIISAGNSLRDTGLMGPFKTAEGWEINTIGNYEVIGSEVPLYSAKKTIKKENQEPLKKAALTDLFKDTKSLLSKAIKKHGVTVELSNEEIQVKAKGGHTLTIKAVDTITPNKLAFKVGYNRQKENGEIIAGSYQDNIIKISDVGDKWTLAHEMFGHWFEDIGILNRTDRSVLKLQIKREVKAGTFKASTPKNIGSAEDRAEWLSRETRRDGKHKPSLQRIIQKVKDFIDSLVNLIQRTSRGIVRDIESGKIFDKKGLPATSAITSYEKTAQRWYSQMEKTLEQKLPGKGTPESMKQAINTFAKKGEYKTEELEWSGVNEWLDEQTGKVTKQEVLDYLSENNVQIKEVVKGDSRVVLLNKKWEDADDAVKDGIISRIPEEEQARLRDMRDDLQDQIQEAREKEGSAQFERYQEPGGENYRELFLTVDDRFGSWQDGHPQYSDIKNPIVRLRINERVDTEGKRVLFLEEVQPPSKEQQEKMPDFMRKPKYFMTMAAKKAVRMAAEGGFDSLGWTPGEIQAARYDLSKHLSEIRWGKVGNEYEIGFTTIDGKDEAVPSTISKEKLPDHVGKELAEKIISSEDSQGDFAGLDLKVGGEGMKSFYDKMLVNEVNKFFNKKKWGKAKVGVSKVQITSKSGLPDYAIDPTEGHPTRWKVSFADGTDLDGTFGTKEKAKEAAEKEVAKFRGLEIWTLPITPEIKQKALREGMPMFAVKEQYSVKQYDKDMSQYSKEAGNFVKDTLTERKKDWKQQKADTKLISRVLSVPLHYFDKIPAMQRMFDAGLRWMDKKHSVVDDLVNSEDGQSYIKVMDDFRKQRRKEFKKWSRYLIDRDRNAKGYSVSEKDGSWVLKDPSGKKVQSFTDEQEAWIEAINSEVADFAKAGYSEQAQDALRAFRAIGHNTYEQLAGQMRQYIKQYKERGKEVPKIVVRQGEEAVSVDLQTALSTMGDRRGYYMPRSRKAGRYRLIATKKGENPVMKFYDTKTMMAIAARKYRGQGYKIEKSRARKIPEVIFEIAGKQVGIQAMVNEALRNVGQARAESLSHYGISGEWGRYKGQDDFVVTGAYTKDIKTAFETLNGRYYALGQDQKAWHFMGAPKDIESQIVKRIQEIKGVTPDTEMLFAANMIQQVADIIRSRGARSKMITRKDAKGKDVWVGYEEDPIIAMTRSAQGIAGAEAKRQLAVDLTQYITGTDIKWSEYKQTKMNEGKKADYKEYIKFVNKRKIDAGEQQNAFNDGVKYMQHMLRNDEQVDRIIGTVKGLAVLKYLGGRVSAPVVNLTAMVTSVPATMKGYAGIPINKSAKYVGQAYNAYRNWSERLNGKKTKLDGWEQDLFKTIEKNGWHKAQLNHEAIAVLQGKLGRGWNKAMELSMLGFGVTEQMNRVSTIAGTYMGIRDRHKGVWGQGEHEKAIKTAKKVSDRAHGVYGKANLPYLAQGGGVGAQAFRSYYVFRTFSHNYLLTMYDLGFKKGQASSMLYMALSPVLFAGIGASVFTPILGAIAKGVGMDDPEEKFYNWLEDTYGKHSEQLARFGLFGAAGYGVSLKGSLAIGVTDLPTSLEDIVGAPGSMVLDMYRGGQSILRGDVGKGIEKMLPLFLGNMMKAHREYTEGVTTKTNAPVFYGREQIKLDTIGAIFRFLSFNPVQIAGKREKQWKESQLERKYQSKKTDIYAKLKRYFLKPANQRNKAEYIDLMTEIRIYNQTIIDNGLWPAMSIITATSTRNNIKRSFKPKKKERLRKKEKK